MSSVKVNKRKITLLILMRLSLGWIFLWAFLDKVFGLGYATEAGSAWLDGVSPTAGYLEFATSGPLAGIFQSLAGNVVVDWLFMFGLLGLGIALILGVALRLAGYAGALLMLLMWLSILPKENNPFMDEHLIYGLILLAMPLADAGQYFGLGKAWAKTSLVKKLPWLA